MIVHATIKLTLHNTGGYSPHMGHSSYLSFEGEDAIEDDGEGKLALCRQPLVGERIVSSTMHSSFEGRIIKVKDHPDRVVVFAEGVLDGTLGSITGGISCHGSWALLKVRKASGTFGTFVGPKALESYGAAKERHRAQLTRPAPASVGGFVPNDLGAEALHLTGVGKEAIAKATSGEAWRVPCLSTYDLRVEVPWISILDRADLRWVRSSLQRRRDWERFRKGYRGTHLARAAEKAGFGEFARTV